MTKPHKQIGTVKIPLSPLDQKLEEAREVKFEMETLLTELEAHFEQPDHTRPHSWRIDTSNWRPKA